MTVLRWWFVFFATVALVTALGCGESTEANPDGTGTFIVSDVPTRNCTLAFVNGFLLQLFNPKLMVYGVTLFTTFFASITDQPVPLFVTVCLLSLTAFCAVTVWASFGTMIKRYLRYPRARLILNIGLSLLLVYTALKLAGLL